MFPWQKKFGNKQPFAQPPPPPFKEFIGRFYNKNPDINWSPYIPQTNSPINYLEIGVADGGNVIQVEKTFAKHPDSKLYCVDPWQDYDEYPEYKGEQEEGWDKFNKNISVLSNPDKFVIKRGFSDDIVPTFPDNFFDIAFVDGNHETEFVYRDGLMALQKTKSGGFIIFDDYCYM
jgi:Methyltransferase domain